MICEMCCVSFHVSIVSDHVLTQTLAENFDCGQSSVARSSYRIVKMTSLKLLLNTIHDISHYEMYANFFKSKIIFSECAKESGRINRDTQRGLQNGMKTHMHGAFLSGTDALRFEQR